MDGTKAVIAAAQEAGVRKLVFTSSAGVVFAGNNVIDLDERAPPPETPFDVYNDSKAHGEAAVLAANGQQGLLTVALRPAGIYGCASSFHIIFFSLPPYSPGDRQMMAGMYEVYQKGQTHFQIGDNTRMPPTPISSLQTNLISHLLLPHLTNFPKRMNIIWKIYPHSPRRNEQS